MKVCTPELDMTAERHLSVPTDGLRDSEITMLLSSGSTSGPTDCISLPEVRRERATGAVWCTNYMHIM